MKKMRLNSAIVRFVGILLLLLLVPFGLLLVYAMGRLSAMERDAANQYLRSNLRTVSATADQVMRNLEFSHTALFMDAAFLNGVRHLQRYASRDEYADFLNTGSIKSCIGRAAAANDYIDSIYAYSFSANRVFSSRVNWDPSFNNFEGQASPWMQTYFTEGLRRPWHITGELRGERTILSSYREVWIYGEERPYGLLSVNMDAAVLTRLLAEATPNQQGYTFVIDGAGNRVGGDGAESIGILSHLQAQMEQSGPEGHFSFGRGGQKMFASYFTSAYSGFVYVTAMRLNQIETSAPVMMWLIVTFVALLVLLVLLAMVLAHHYFFKPVKILFAGMRRVQDGDFAARLPENTTYEFSYINRNFNEMTKNIQRLVTENYTGKLVNKEAQLRNIQNQLNEHFLYNTLDSIHWLARRCGAAEVCDMVFAMANFYRASLSFGRDVISVRDVAEMQRNYLYIQKVRMRGELSYNVDCEETLAGEMVLKNLLTPLVENVVVHGIQNLSRPAVISVSIRAENGAMRVKVEDNGNGFSPRQLERVQAQLDLKDPYCDHSFALKTLQSQLQIFYGLDIRLNISTALGKGTAVFVDLPLSGGQAPRERGKPPC